LQGVTILSTLAFKRLRHAIVSYKIDLYIFLSISFSSSPDVEIIRPVLCMNTEGVGKDFSLCLFKSWCHEEARELAHVLAQLLSKPSSTGKKKHGKYVY